MCLVWVFPLVRRRDDLRCCVVTAVMAAMVEVHLVAMVVTVELRLGWWLYVGGVE